MDLKPAALALALVTGCASTLDWSKPGATQDAVDTDLKACRVAAERYPAAPRLPSTPPSGTGTLSTGTDRDADTQLTQAQRVETCMRSRGYQLVRR